MLERGSDSSGVELVEPHATPREDHDEVGSVGRAKPAGFARGGTTLRKLLGAQETVPLVALVLLVLVVGLTHSRFFDSQAIIANVRVAAFVAIIAYGLVLLLAMAEIDLSVGGTYGIAFFVCAKLGSDGMDMYLAAVIAVTVGAALGLANGLLVLLFRAPTIIVTLGTYSLYAGLVSVLSGGNSIGQDLPLDSSFFTTLGGDWLGLPVAGWIALLLAVVFTVVLLRTRFGATIRAVGSNPSAAAFTGIPASRIRVYALIITGALAGLSGVLTLAYASGGDANIGAGFELQVIAAAIIGGTAITGGGGSVPGALIGALIVATINSGLVFFDVSPLWTNVVTGVVILLAVGTASLVSQRRAGRQARLNQ